MCYANNLCIYILQKIYIYIYVLELCISATPSVLSYVCFRRVSKGRVARLVVLTAAWADRWRAGCHRYVPDRWARRVRCPNRCCRVDPVDSPAVPDDCSTAVAVPRPAWMMMMTTMRPIHRWLHYRRQHPTDDCCVAAPLAVPIAAAAVQLRIQIQLSVAAAVGRRPRPIHLIVLLTHPNDPTFLYFTDRFDQVFFIEMHTEDFVVCCCVCGVCCVSVCVCVCVCVARGTTVVVVVVVSDRGGGQIRFEEGGTKSNRALDWFAPFTSYR